MVQLCKNSGLSVSKEKRVDTGCSPLKRKSKMLNPKVRENIFILFFCSSVFMLLYAHCVYHFHSNCLNVFSVFVCLFLSPTLPLKFPLPFPLSFFLSHAFFSLFSRSPLKNVSLWTFPAYTSNLKVFLSYFRNVTYKEASLIGAFLISDYNLVLHAFHIHMKVRGCMQYTQTSLY